MRRSAAAGRADRPGPCYCWTVAEGAVYDRIADWYDAWVGDGPGVICEQAPGLLPERLAGRRVLDAACGQGRAARELARRGASVVGVDVSARLVARAEAREAARPLGVRYVVADLATPSAWWDGVPFDGAVCEMALMDIAALDDALAAVARVLVPGGWFVTSLVHPCLPGSERGLSSWPPDRGYAAEGWWSSRDHNPDGARVRIGAHHRTLATYLNALTGAGLAVERAVEPPADVPTLLVLACRRSAA
jgi:SAM-dependent methyltransferase